VFWFDDITSRPAALIRDVLRFLGVDDKWTPAEPDTVVARSPDGAVITAEDAAEVAAYYAPWDRRLCSLLGLAALPWSTRER